MEHNPLIYRDLSSCVPILRPTKLSCPSIRSSCTCLSAFSDAFVTLWFIALMYILHNGLCNVQRYNIMMIKSFPPTSGLRSSCMHVCQALEPAVLVCQALPMHLYHAVEVISVQLAICNFSRQARLDSSSRRSSRISRRECT